MGLKLGIWISFLAGHSGSRDLTLDCTIWKIYRKELLSIWCVCVCVLGRSRLTVVSLLPCFRGRVWGVKYCLNRCSSFSFRNKFIFLLPFGLLVDNNTFQKIWVFKSQSHTHAVLHRVRFKFPYEPVPHISQLWSFLFGPAGVFSYHC